MNSPPPRLLTVPAAAKSLGLSRSRLYDELRTGRLASLKVGHRRLIPAEALDSWIIRHTQRGWL